MFALFYSLYFSMFTGSWNNYSLNDISSTFRYVLNPIGQLITSIFGDNQYTSFGTDFSINSWIGLASLILATITSIGIVVMAVKGVKRAFGIFFMGIRR